MVTNTWYQYNEAWYYLGPDGAMCKSQLVENSGKIYALDTDGKMITEPVKLTPDQAGALQYSGLKA
jgi:glucan-binding YG repeat protein